MSTTNSQTFKNPSIHVQKAIEKLQAFNRRIDFSPKQQVQKTSSFMDQFFAKFYSREKKDKVNFDKNEVLHAIEVLKSHYWLIPQWHKGSSQQRKLAESAYAVIAQFNGLIDKVQVKQFSITDKISALFAKQQPEEWDEFEKIDVPQRGLSVSSNLMPVNKIITLSQSMVATVSLPMPAESHLTKRAVELFYMKAISLIESDGLLSNVEARSALRTASISSHKLSDTLCEVNCELKPFPGHYIAVQGHFLKDSISSCYTIPDVKSFHVTFTSMQTGFPHPLQLAGWALPDLVPVSRQDLQESKVSAARALLPNGEFIEKAKYLVQRKKEAFETNKEELLRLHHELCKALILAMSPSQISEKTLLAADMFYRRLATAQNSYECLSHSYQTINTIFVNRPLENWHMVLENNSMTGQEALTFLNNEIVLAQDQLERQCDKSHLEFIRCMGQLVAPICFSIKVNEFTANRGGQPAELTMKARKLSEISENQLSAFLKELNQPFFDRDAGETMKLLLVNDIAILSSLTFMVDSYEKNHP